MGCSLIISVACLGAGHEENIEVLSRLFGQADPPRVHSSLNAEQLRGRAVRETNYQALLEEKLARRWFAALLAMDESNPYAIERRFESASAFARFIEQSDPLVELWTRGESNPSAVLPVRLRRLEAAEIAEQKRSGRAQPSILMLTYRAPASQQVVTNMVEFGFHAGEELLASQRSYARARELSLMIQEVLAARDHTGNPSGRAQHDALQNKMIEESLEIVHPPARPAGRAQLFIAAELAVNEHGHVSGIQRFYREDEVRREIQGASAKKTTRPKSGGRSTAKGMPSASRSSGRKSAHFPSRSAAVQPAQPLSRSLPLPLGEGQGEGLHFPSQSAMGRERLYLYNPKSGEKREVVAFRASGVSDQLEPVATPILGQDIVELRVKNPAEPDPRKWNILQFGEPELLRLAGLSKFSLLNAHLEANRKRLALKKAKLDLFAEPVIAAINVGGGLSGLVFPAGDAARLLWNVVAPEFIADVPDVKELRQLFALTLARAQDPNLRSKAIEFLTRDEIERLRARAKLLSDSEVQTYLGQVSDVDLQAMLRLARMQTADARLSNFLSVLGSVGKVSGQTEAGVMRDVLNSPYFSLTGEVNIKTIIAVLAGQKMITPLSGTSLETLSQGRGPTQAWLQYFDISVDFRAVANSIARLAQDSLAEKEIEKPFPYALRLRDLAAYEIRIFGFPLLLFYKRGLMKADYQAYTNDYAYGVIGARIVERFATRAEMDAEIRAGRMFPLGYVKTPTPSGWKESNLAVFAHQLPEGKDKGRIAIIMYGLKAYEEHSEFIERELERFKKYETLLREGGVIEQVIHTPTPTPDRNPPPTPAVYFEPVLKQTNAAEFDRLLSALLEAKAFFQKQRLGLPAQTNTAALAELSGRGIPWSSNALAGVDRFFSSYLYRRDKGEGLELVKMVYVPSLQEIRRELVRAEEDLKIELLREQTLRGQNPALVFLNEALPSGNGYEIGPPHLVAADASPPAPGYGETGPPGILTGWEAEQVLDVIESLPVMERARFALNHFAGVLSQLPGRDGSTNQVFVTVEFPLGQSERVLRDPLTGKDVRQTYERARLRRSSTENFTTEFRYNEEGLEIGSSTYSNQGTLERPEKGPLIERRQTLEVWADETPDSFANPARPRKSTLRINFVTGAIEQELYGLYAQPVAVMDPDHVTTNIYTPRGELASAVILENGVSDDDAARAVLERVLRPVPGLRRFELTRAAPLLHPDPLPKGEGREKRPETGELQLIRKDLVKGIERTVMLDLTHLGRILGEHFTETFDQTNTFQHVVTHTYGTNYFGLIPIKSQTAIQGEVVSSSANLSYDPVARVTVGVESSYTGKMTTNRWSAPFQAPLEITTGTRKTTLTYDRRETRSESKTVGLASGELISSSAAQYNTASNSWQVTRSHWHGPNVLARTETVLLSPSGRLIAIEAGNVLLSKPLYDGSGREISLVAFHRDASNQLSIVRIEDEYRWQKGGREARARLYAGNALYDTYGIRGDAEGRVIEDGIKRSLWGNFRTTHAFDSDTDRKTESVHWQDDQVRTRFTWGAVEMVNNAPRLAVAAQPAWGLSWTDYYDLNDPLGRQAATLFQNGERISYVDWHGGTAIARTTELLNQGQRPRQRMIRELRTGARDGFNYDTVRVFNVDPWSRAFPLAERAVVSGSDLVLFEEARGERVVFDPASLFPAPLYASDISGRRGVSYSVNGKSVTNVLAVYHHHFENAGLPSDSSSRHAEALAKAEILIQTKAEFKLGFSLPFTVATLDRGGRLVSARYGKVPAERSIPEFAELLKQIEHQPPEQQWLYHYEPGWLIESPADGVGVLVWTNQPAAGSQWLVNQSGNRDWLTRLELIHSASTQELQATALSKYLLRVYERPRDLKSNRHLPDASSGWREWSVTDFNTAGEVLFPSTAIYDSAGEPATIVASLRNSLQKSAAKVACTLPATARDAWQSRQLSAGTNRVRLDHRDRKDWSAYEFLYFEITAGQPVRLALIIRDAGGKAAVVRQQQATGADLSFWPATLKQTKWLPNDVVPRLGAVLAPPANAEPNSFFAVSISELEQSGLNTAALSSFDLEITARTAGECRVTPLSAACEKPLRLGDEAKERFFSEVEYHSSGLQSYVRAKAGRSEEEIKADQGWNAVVQYQGKELAVARAQAPGKTYPTLMLVDASNPDLVKPLYSLAVDTGKFLEYYKTLKWGDSAVYTVTRGFETPKLEIYRSGVLDDEISPGILAYGSGFYVTIPLAKASDGLARNVADIRNRVVSSAFKFGGDKARAFAAGEESINSLLGVFDQKSILAETQSREINRLPMLAETLLPGRAPPWAEATNSSAVVLPATNELRRIWMRLGRMHLNPLYAETGLIPTQPDGLAARYVDTVKEAELILLAIDLRQFTLARELLEFYLQKSEGGQLQIHGFYDAQSGASLAFDPRYERPTDSFPTAEAQVAISQAAFAYGLATKDPVALQFAENALLTLLHDFRWITPRAAWSRALADRPPRQQFSRHDITFWPEGETYAVKSNARALLLFDEILRLSGEIPFSGAWRGAVTEARDELNHWFKTEIVPHVERTGVVPKGLFEIQDIHQETASYAAERWTAAEDWLWFLQAAANFQWAQPARLQSWLENLAKVHGVTVHDTWGLDWSIAYRRPDALSPELTARFAAVARLLGHERAERFALGSLARIRERMEYYPIAFTSAARAPFQTGQGPVIYPSLSRLSRSWPEDLFVYRPLLRLASAPSFALGPESTPARAANLNPNPTLTPSFLTAFSEIHRGKPTRMRMTPAMPEQRDVTAFIWTSLGFYLAILGAAIFWWLFFAMRRARRRRELEKARVQPLVPEQVMRAAEERWAKRVLGLQIPGNAERSRYSNAAIEQNFHMQLRAIYKTVLEWRRLDNGWSENDPRLIESDQDGWLNGLDEFAAMIGIYSRWVVKAGKKDGATRYTASENGAPQREVLLENEDSNHLWSRLLMYFSEYHTALLTLLQQYQADTAGRFATNDEIAQMLRTMGARRRNEAFDGRKLFDAPANPQAMDLLVIQAPNASLEKVAQEMADKLRIPLEHFTKFVLKYKEFKEREQIYPVHPYLLEVAKMLPHFLLMGLVALIWYNNEVGGLLVYPYLKNTFFDLILSPSSLLWAIPLAAGFTLSVIAEYLKVYRYEARKRTEAPQDMLLDLTLTSFFKKSESVLPKVKESRWWNPHWYELAGWSLRGGGLILLGLVLLKIPAPSFVTFLMLKGWVAMIIFAEAAALILPLMASRISQFLEDYVTDHPRCSRAIRFLNELNVTATRPASLIWLSIKYHFQPSLPSGGFWPMLQCILFYFIFAACFFITGGYIAKEVLTVWFAETYQIGANWKLFLGGFIFLNTIYLLRFGLFVLFTGLGAAFLTFPLRTPVFLAALVYLGLTAWDTSYSNYLLGAPWLTYGILALVLLALTFEERIIEWFRQSALGQWLDPASRGRTRAALEQIKKERSRALGVVYMSGDELGYFKLTPELLMGRWEVLRDKLDSEARRLLEELHVQSGLMSGAANSDAQLAAGFKKLYELEKAHDVTLWHPDQLHLPEEGPRLPIDSGLNLPVLNQAERDELLGAWHLRRWLVTMMSTAGHSQDTAINLVDIALRLREEGLNELVVFYLIQNKYEGSDKNRPSQLPYDQAELGHRNKLARLLMLLVPGLRAYSINDWTPFGFKAGGLVGMDLVHEESLRLSNMLVLDRNATGLDLDSIMDDIATALADPGVVIVIPGRSTTNTLTPIGQGSQMLEEGHRALTKGVMFLGGVAAESVGTGWGNIQAVYYGRIQQALLNPAVHKLPLTFRMRRGSAFGDRFEGLIGFGPHAVGISEDIWGVTQTAHNAIALGAQVKFRRSKTLWHKIRETWSHAEWFSAFSRWAGGYLQMMHDPIMQRINDGGPLSVFAKEIRANGGRFYLSAPLALLNILIMPLAIMLNASPFIHILVILWNFGFIMNQILTVHGLIAMLESAGFNKIPAWIGAASAGLLSALSPALFPFTPGLIPLGFLTGGFITGFGRWLYDRGRDLILFGPQLIIHALGQVIRQSLEFVVSGAAVQDAKGVNVAFRSWAGPREDRPFETFPSILNLRSIVWGVGLLSLGLNLFALAYLDFLNVVLLLPSLLFTVSALAGPFLLKPKAGLAQTSSKWLPKICGWVAGVLFYGVVAALVARRGFSEWIALFLFGACFGLILWRALKYAGYHRRLRRLTARFVNLGTFGGLPEKDAAQLAQNIIRNLGGDLEKSQAAIEKSSAPPEAKARLTALVQKQLSPHLKKPWNDVFAPSLWKHRFFSEASRSFVLSLLTFLWFFIVPIPGLLIFTAGDYRLSMDLGLFNRLVLGVIGGALLLALLGRVVEACQYFGARSSGLRHAVKLRYAAFRGALHRKALPPLQTATLFAAFTSIQTYIDQRSYAYARRALRRIDEILRKL